MHLTFGHNFNQSMTDALPNSLTHLTFDDHFNQPIKDALPDSLIEIALNRLYVYRSDLPKKYKLLLAILLFSFIID
jgi:hypothetical protein